MFKVVVSPPSPAASKEGAREGRKSGGVAPLPSPRGRGAFEAALRGKAVATEGVDKAVAVEPVGEGEARPLGLFPGTKEDGRGYLLPPARVTQLDTVMPTEGAAPLGGAAGDADLSWEDVMDAVVARLRVGSK